MKRAMFPVAPGLIFSLLLIACAKPAPSPTPTTPTATTATPAATPKASPTPTAAPTSAPQYGGILKINVGEPPGRPIGWPLESVGAGLWLIQSAFDTLVRMDYRGNIQPLLATSWDIPPDGKSVTFRLRKGVKFHDGTDFNAEITKWYFEKVQASKHSATQTWTTIDVIDDYTLRINFSRWENVTMMRLAGTVVFIPSRTSYEKMGLDWTRLNMVGTGAFKQVSYQPSVQATLARFDGYWQKNKPFVDELRYVFIPDTTTAALSFAAGEVQALSMGDAEVFIRDNLDKAGKKYLTAGAPEGLAGPLTLWPDTGNPESPFANQKVREAVEYAIDREAIAKGLGRGEQQAAYQVAPAKSWAYNPGLEARYRRYDPKKAKELLTAAGHPNGFKTKIITSSSAIRDQMVPVTTYLKEIGIDAPVEFVTAAAYTQLHTGGWRNSLLAAVLNQSTEPFVGTLQVSYFTPGQWYTSVKKSEKFMELYAAVLTAMDLDKQKAASKEMNTLIFDEAMYIPLTRTERGKLSGPLYVEGIHDPGFNYREVPNFWQSENIWMEKKAWLNK
ncbi:MAG: ABC transporter substrate-binding protein [Chloroflexi bacterium]|nr:ABC transporter substrate-binding protein [Chloroflexota bacterium]